MLLAASVLPWGKLKVPIQGAIFCAPRLDFSSIPQTFVSSQLSLCQVPESLATELPPHLGHRQVKTIQPMGLWGFFPRVERAIWECFLVEVATQTSSWVVIWVTYQSTEPMVCLECEQKVARGSWGDRQCLGSWGPSRVWPFPRTIWRSR